MQPKGMPTLYKKAKMKLKEIKVWMVPQDWVYQIVNTNFYILTVIKIIHLFSVI